jgi:cytoskeletal protein CcmA (bactofilin family)
MAIFNKPPGERAATRMDAPPGAESSTSVVADGMIVHGDVETAGVLKIDGVIEGAVRQARQVLLGKTGVLRGDVHTVDAVIGGTIVGNVIASDRVELQSTASVEGDIHTKSIVVFEGGSINGAVRMGDAKGQSRPVNADQRLPTES